MLPDGTYKVLVPGLEAWPVGDPKNGFGVTIVRLTTRCRSGYSREEPKAEMTSREVSPATVNRHHKWFLALQPAGVNVNRGKDRGIQAVSDLQRTPALW